MYESDQQYTFKNQNTFSHRRPRRLLSCVVGNQHVNCQCHLGCSFCIAFVALKTMLWPVNAENGLIKGPYAI